MAIKFRKMRLSLTFITVFLVIGCFGEKTDIELDAKATKLHQIDSLVSE